MVKGLIAPKGNKQVSFHIVKPEPSTLGKPDKLQAPPKPSYPVEQILDKWGLEQKLNLAELSADFYVLLDLEIDHPYDLELKSELSDLTQFLADQFSRYLDMAIGGELRHALSHSNMTNIDFRSSFSRETRKLANALSEEEGLQRPPYRQAQWLNWFTFRAKYGLDALHMAYELFSYLDWADEYGGEMWATATSVLIDYLTGGLTPRTFVDTAWGIQHNNSIIYDKLWNTRSLRDVLDYNQEGDMREVAVWASDKVRRIRSRLQQQ